jgi:hypothetical protein
MHGDAAPVTPSPLPVMLPVMPGGQVEHLY